MTKKIISEGNSKIGKFMGKSFKDPMNYMYDKSWSELMPVWEKISKLKSRKFSIETMEISKKTCYIKAFQSNIPYTKSIQLNALNCIDIEECDNLIEAVYKTIIDFINWHNKIK